MPPKNGAQRLVNVHPLIIDLGTYGCRMLTGMVQQNIENGKVKPAFVLYSAHMLPQYADSDDTTFHKGGLQTSAPVHATVRVASHLETDFHGWARFVFR